MERKIGERFLDNGVELEVIKEEDTSICVGCYYEDSIKGCIKNEKFVGSCSSFSRKDSKDVIFKEVEK